jgi:hypothetical protein
MIKTGDGLICSSIGGWCTQSLIVWEERHNIVAKKEVKPNDRETQ